MLLCVRQKNFMKLKDWSENFEIKKDFQLLVGELGDFLFSTQKGKHKQIHPQGDF